jgi:hypothetical protein
VGAIDFITNIAGVAGLFAPMGRSYGKPISGKIRFRRFLTRAVGHDKMPIPWPQGRLFYE